MFSGDMSGGFVRKVKPLFNEVHLDHPKASRSSSSEVYVVALEYRLD
jgi:23S rRNA U2552 (ribose-2'-O)-methylase RlmE/FtsJ